MQEVTGSIPVTSTNPESPQQKSPSSRGLGHRPFTAVTGVRIPVGTPLKIRARPDHGGARRLSAANRGDRWPAARAGDDIARVDVAGLLSRDDLQRPASQIVDKDCVRLLVRRNDRALRKVARVKPEREVVLVSSLRGLQRQARTNGRLRSGEAGVKRQQQKEYGEAERGCPARHRPARFSSATRSEEHTSVAI